MIFRLTANRKVFTVDATLSSSSPFRNLKFAFYFRHFFHFCLFLHFISGKILKSGFKVTPRFLGLGDFVQRVLVFYSTYLLAAITVPDTAYDTKSVLFSTLYIDQ